MPEVRLLGKPSHLLKKIENKIDQALERLDAIERSLAAAMVVKEDRLYSRAECAHLLGISRRSVDRRVRNEQLNTVRRGRSVLITGKSLLRINHDERRLAVEVLRI